MFAIFNSTQEKSITKKIAKDNETQLLSQILFSVPFSVYFWLNGWV